MRESFENRHVVVTGAAGALGGAVVRRLIERGAVCHLPVRSAVPELVASAGGKLTEQLRVVEGVDLADEKRVGGFYAGLPELWASIHCAGGFAPAPVAETGSADLFAMWRVNTLTAFLCCREAVKILRSAGGGGRLVNVVARPALEPRTGSGMLAYTASKAALSAMTQALAEEVAQEGIWVNAVAPSILDTPDNRRAMPGSDPSKWVRVEDAAETIVYLASPRNLASRGAVVPVYGKS